MDNNLSPFKLSPYKVLKQNISPFKKFIPRSPKNEDLKNLGLPLKYMNTDANPEIGKGLA